MEYWWGSLGEVFIGRKTVWGRGMTVTSSGSKCSLKSDGGVIVVGIEEGLLGKQ